MTSPVLYDYWRSSASYRVRIALNLKNIEYESVTVDLLSNEHKQPTHTARNPQGLVPVLEIDSNSFTQSLAIIEYLDETRPEPNLLPENAGERVRVRSLCHAIAMEIHPICNLSVINHVIELTGDESTKQKWMQHYIGTGLNAFEQLLDHPQTGNFCHGDSPTMADCCLIPQLYNADRWEVDISKLSRINHIARSCNEIAAITQAHPNCVGPPSQ